MPSSSATAPRLLPWRNALTTAFGVALLASLALASWRGAAALALGSVGTAAYLAGTWAVVRLSAGTAGPTLRQAVLTALLLLMKLPLIYLGWVLAQRLGPFGPLWFLVGLGLVYSAVLWRAVLAVRD